jgi:signal transduction histidine kinase
VARTKIEQSAPVAQAPDEPGNRYERHLGASLASFPFDLQSRLVDAASVQDVYEIGVAMLARIPATIGVRIFQRDDHGELLLVHAWQSPLVSETSASPDELSKAVHQRWIAAHRVGHNTLEFARPFYLAKQPRWLIVPMLAGDELIGAIAAERRDGETFPYAAEDVVAFASAAAGMSWGIRSVFLHDRTDLLSNLEAREDIMMQERRQIGRELHDNVVQNLAYLNMKLEIVEKYVTGNPAIAGSELQAARALLDRSITELRRTIGDARRPVSQRRGITGQLRSLASTIAIDASEFEMDLKQISGLQPVPEIERAVVGIVREALQNVRKHANANSVRLEVNRTDEELKVCVYDDGVGMPGNVPPQRPGHFGVEQMRELAEDLGGKLTIESQSGHGTTIEATLPLAVSPSYANSQVSSESGASEQTAIRHAVDREPAPNARGNQD